MRKTVRLITGIFALLLAWQISFAQTRALSGTVKDNKGEAIIGASVLVKGTTTGTYTDVDGNFSLAVPSSATTLQFKYLGYKPQEVAIGASNVVNVTMEEDVLGIDEVVVTAIGITSEKKALGYSTQEVNGDQLNQSGSGNALSELSGKVAGLTVISSSGVPGAGTYLQLRGVTSLTGNNQPLIVVDGVPIDNSVNGYDPTSGTTGGGSSANPVGGVGFSNRGIDIDPSNIASITVLKGPAASALYGISGASGAIIITTKKGGSAKGGAHVSLTSSTSIEQVNQLPELQNKFSQGTAESYLGPETHTRTSYGANVDTLYWDGDNSYAYDTHGAIVGQSDPSAQTKITPYDNLGNFFVNGSTLDNNLALSGGTQSLGYRISLGNVHQSGVVPLTTYNKNTVTLSGQAALTAKLSVSGSLSYLNSTSNRAQQGSNVSGLMLGLLRTPITFDNANGTSDPANDSSAYVLPDGSQRNYRGGAGYDNPYWTINRNPFSDDLNREYGNVQADLKPWSWLTLTYRLGGDIYSQNNKQAYDIASEAFTTGLVYLDDYNSKLYNSDFLVTLQRDFSEDFRGSLILGHNYFTQSTTRSFSQGTGFAVPEFYDMSNASSVLSSEAESKYRTMAFYGDAQLEYKNMLYLNLTGRDETTSTLAADNNTFFYPSANLSWVFTEPLGLSDNKILPYGKLRLSYAQVAKDAPLFALQTYYSNATVADGFTTGDQFPINGLNGSMIATYAPLSSVVGNAGLVPEKTNSFEAGLDLAFLQNRISLSATYFNEKTHNEIFQVPISSATGWGYAILNAGEVSNKGVELTLNATPVKLNNGLRWDLTLNWSKYNNMVDSLYPGIDNLFINGFQNGAIYAVQGEPFGVIYGSDYVRTDDGQMVINDDPSDPGYGKPIPGSVNTILGNIQPDWIGSITSNLMFKNFTFSFQIDIHQGGQLWDGTRGALAYFGRAKETEGRNVDTKTFDGVLGHVDANGDIVHYGSDGTTEEAGAGATNTVNTVLDDYYWQNIGNSFVGPTQPDVEDASNTRVRQISLSYDFSKSLIKSNYVYGLTLTVFANNPFLWTKYSGVDPETSLVGPINGQGLDYFNMPGTRSYGVRLTLGL